jgi:Arc/MetJ-type ribon-helix-helix transcriptional regulator
MPGQRSKGQRGIIVMMRESFIEEIDGSLLHCGYTDRSSFIRDAVYEKLERMGISIPLVEKTAPQRSGKGGRKKSHTLKKETRKTA